MPFANGVAAAVGRTPLIKLQARLRGDRLHHPRQGRVHEPRPVGQGPRRALHHPGCGEARHAAGPAARSSRARPATPASASPSIGNALGFRTVIVIPETQSQEKKDALRLLGAELVEVPALPYKNPNNYVHYSQRLAEALAKTEPNGAIWANQWDNVANRQAHIETTAQEIWAETDGKVDGFVSAVGSGGTLGGVSDGLKAKRKDIQIALADVPGAALYSYYTTGELKSEGSSITEGIGQGRVTKNIEGAVVDRAYLIPDAESVADLLPAAARRRACAWAARPASTSPAPSASPRRWARATPSSPCSATTARATSPSSSIRNSCDRRTCRCPKWLVDKRAAAAQDVRRPGQGVRPMTEQLHQRHARGGGHPRHRAASSRRNCVDPRPPRG